MLIDFLYYAFMAIVTLALFYTAWRLASIAYFRSKAEYDRLPRRRPLNGENHNAKD